MLLLFEKIPAFVELFIELPIVANTVLGVGAFTTDELSAATAVVVVGVV